MKTTVRMRDLKAGDVLLDANHKPWIHIERTTSHKRDSVIVVKGRVLQDWPEGAGEPGWTSGHAMTNVNILREPVES